MVEETDGEYDALFRAMPAVFRVRATAGTRVKKQLRDAPERFPLQLS